jgi:hypothetical protein
VDIGEYQNRIYFRTIEDCQQNAFDKNDKMHYYYSINYFLDEDIKASEYFSNKQF